MTKDAIAVQFMRTALLPLTCCWTCTLLSVNIWLKTVYFFNTFNAKRKGAFYLHVFKYNIE